MQRSQEIDRVLRAFLPHEGHEDVQGGAVHEIAHLPMMSSEIIQEA